jgi:hypothetical protein
MTKMPTHDLGPVDVDGPALKHGGRSLAAQLGWVRCAGSISRFPSPQKSVVYHFIVLFTCGFVLMGQPGGHLSE